MKEYHNVTRRKLNFFLGPSLNKSVDLHSTISDKGMHKLDRGMPKNQLNFTQTSGTFSSTNTGLFQNLISDSEIVNQDETYDCHTFDNDTPYKVINMLQIFFITKFLFQI